MIRVLWLFVAALVLWLVGLGDLALRDWDEGYYGVVARDMFRTGNWLYPTYLGEPFLLKPPLMIWSIAVSYSLGGVSEFATRFPGACLSACSVPLLYWLGRELFGNRLSSVFGASVYLTLLPVVRHGRLAMLDGAINSFLILSCLCLLKARQNEKWAIGIGIGLGAIALTKGVLVVVLGAILAVFLLVDRRFDLLKNIYLWLGFIVGFLPVFLWYFLQIKHYGSVFVETHFHSQSLDRLSTSVDGHGGEVWYYLVELLKYTVPWLVFLPGSFYFAWQERRKSWGMLVLIGTILYMGTISLMGTKLPWYIMPVYPFIALAVGSYLEKLWQNSKQYSQFFIGFFGFLGFAALGGCVYFISSDPQPISIFMAIVLAIAMGLVAWQMQQNNRMFIPILLVGIYTTLLLFVNSHSWIWELNEAFPVKSVASLIRSHTPTGAKIYTSFGYDRPSLDFYSDRRVIARDITALKQLESKQAYLLLDREAMEQLSLSKSISLGSAEGFTLVVSPSD